MMKNQELDRIAISVRSHRLLNRLLDDNPALERIMRNARNETEALIGVRNWILEGLSPEAERFFRSSSPDRALFGALAWEEYAAIRVLDYVENAGREYTDPNLHGEVAVSNPIRMVWLAVTHGTGGAKPWFFEDMLQLFRQLRGEAKRPSPSRPQLEAWMDRYPSGLDPRIVALREENRERIINVIIDDIDARTTGSKDRRAKKKESPGLPGKKPSGRYKFREGMSREQKFLAVVDWWEDWRFHLAFAVRDPDELNRMLGDSLDPDTMHVLREAKDAGIPFFVNPYYLSLLHVRVPYFAVGADLAIRHYVLYSRELVEEFGRIAAWEKEDVVREGEPNAAGWILPSSRDVHRRYPEVAIVIPQTMGRACGGLCSSCQRMFGFQRGDLNFDLERLKPGERWGERLRRYMDYFEEDAQLRDVLITGGDALMSSDKNLEAILDAVLDMATRKRAANEAREEGEKYAEIQRVRLGTRMPVYLPQRVTPELVDILVGFRERALEAGIQQFVIQTHFESPLELSPESRRAIAGLQNAGWTVTNQLVFTAAASRRGHSSKLRQVLSEVGVLPYYTFTVKGYMENSFNFAPNARAVQEQLEEKIHGAIPEEVEAEVAALPEDPGAIREKVAALRERFSLPFLATDRNVLNLPGVGKSLTYRVIGITRYGRRILEFDHDATRRHSPIIEDMGKIIIIESKAIAEYLEQLEEIGEDPQEYEGLYGYSLGVTEPRSALYDYPDLGYDVADRLTNLVLPER